MAMILLVGLGNPGPRYQAHRHNIGFMAVDSIARHHAFSAEKSRFSGHVRSGTVNTRHGPRKALILKPATYMNESGRAVGEAARFYKLPPEDIVVFHDELDLAPGKVRVKCGGGHAGHNGLRSIQAHIGPNFRRVRLGIGHPGRKDLAQRYVLHDFASSDKIWLEPLLDAVGAFAGLLVEGDDATFMNRITLALREAAPPDDEETP